MEIYLVKEGDNIQDKCTGEKVENRLSIHSFRSTDKGLGLRPSMIQKGPERKE